RRRFARPPRPVAPGAAALENNLLPSGSGVDVGEPRPAPGPQVAAAYLPRPDAPGVVPGRALRPHRPRPVCPLPVHPAPVAVAVFGPGPPAALLGGVAGLHPRHLPAGVRPAGGGETAHSARPVPRAAVRGPGARPDRPAGGHLSGA